MSLRHRRLPNCPEAPRTKMRQGWEDCIGEIQRVFYGDSWTMAMPGGRGAEQRGRPDVVPVVDVDKGRCRSAGRSRHRNSSRRERINDRRASLQTTAAGRAATIRRVPHYGICQDRDAEIRRHRNSPCSAMNTLVKPYGQFQRIRISSAPRASAEPTPRTPSAIGAIVG